MPTLKIKLGKRKRGSSEDEEAGSAEASGRDSDVEFEEMLRDAEERSNAKKEEEATTQVVEGAEEQQPRRKAKTKFGSKTKKKGRKVKSTNKDGEEQYEVCT